MAHIVQKENITQFSFQTPCQGNREVHTTACAKKVSFLWDMIVAHSEWLGFNRIKNPYL